MYKSHKVYTILKDGRPYTYSGFKYQSQYYPGGLERPQHDDPYLIDDLPEEKAKEALDTLSRWFEKSNKTSLRHTSYGYKHWLEDAIMHYVSNNQLKDAMLKLGFEPGNYDELNWCFKVKPTAELKQWLKENRRDW